MLVSFTHTPTPATLVTGPATLRLAPTLHLYSTPTPAHTPTHTHTHPHPHLHPPTPRPCSHTAQAKPAGARRPTRPIRPLLRPGHAARHRHGRVKCSICRLHSPALDVLAAGMPTWQGQNYTYLIARFPTHPPCTPLNKPELDNHKCVLVFTSRADRHTQALRSLTYFSPPKGLRVSRVSRALPLLLLHVASH